MSIMRVSRDLTIHSLGQPEIWWPFERLWKKGKFVGGCAREREREEKAPKKKTKKEKYSVL